MGGVAGHLAHLYDNRELTYNEMATILKAAASGELQGTEKTDGYNIYLGFVNGEAKAARNKGDMSRGGMSLADLMARSFQGGEKARTAYVKSFQAYKAAIESLSDEEQAQIFGPNGEIFYNAEIQGPLARNVINYDENVINIHRMGHKKYDRDSNSLELVPAEQIEPASMYLDSLIDSFEDTAADEDFKIRRTAFVELNTAVDKALLDKTLAKIQSTGYTGDMTLNEYLKQALEPIIDRYAPDLDEIRRKALLERALEEDHAPSLTQIGKGLPRERKIQLSQFVKDVAPEEIKNKIWPIELAIHEFAVHLLKGVKSAYILDNTAETEQLKSAVEQAIVGIQAYDGPHRDEAHEILSKQLKKLKKHTRITTPIEGVAFQYCHENGDCYMYKLTGNFAPINQLLGLFKYGRGKMPPMKLNEQSDRIERIIAIYPGRFQPMGKHHAEVFKKIQDEYGLENSFMATSSKTEPQRSPFNFSEKQMIASMHGIPAENVIMTKNPYRAVEILDRYDPDTTAVVYFVGAKDMAEDPRFASLGGITKKGTPRYFREYDRGEDMKGWGKHGYINVAPHVSIDIPEVGEMSGTNLRQVLQTADEDLFEKIMGFYDEEIYGIIKKKIQGLKEDTQYNLGIFRGLVQKLIAEVYTDKQRKWACAQTGDARNSFKGTPSLSAEEAEEMCTATTTPDGEDLEEMASAMGGGAVGGYAGGRPPKKKKNKEIVNEFYNYLLHKLEG